MNQKNIRAVTTSFFLIAVGAILLFNNLNLLPFTLPPFLFTWQAGLVLLGLFLMARLKVIEGLIVSLVGMYFLSPIITNWPVLNLKLYWPVIIIVAGILFLVKGLLKKEKPRATPKNKEDVDISNTVIFGGKNRKVSSYNFRGGDLTAIFGGMEIDLTNCYLSKENNVLDVNVVFGGIELYVSKEWNINIEATPIMGSIEDEEKGEGVDPAAVLTIRGEVIFGGLEIHRV